MKSDSFGCVMVSHYERLFELVPPSHVHILVDGKIVLSGGQELIIFHSVKPSHKQMNLISYHL